MRAAAAILFIVAVSGAVEQATALRKAEAVASPLLAYTWMPWKNENGVWQKPSEANPDFSKMTLADLPPPDLYLQVALTSPYVVPQVPLERVINNTIAHLNDGKLPSSAKQWVQMAGNAGNFFAQNMPFFMARAMQVFMDGISVNGKPLSDLSGLQNTAIDASKALKALPQLLNMTMMGMDVAKISAMAEKLNIKLPTLTNEMSSSIDELKKLPTLLTISKEGLTMDDIKKLPSVLEQVATTTANAADAFAKQLQAFQMPRLEELFDADGVNAVKNFVQSKVNIDIPEGAPVQKVLVNVTKAIPAIASQLGFNIEGLDKIPQVIEALEKTIEVAKTQGFVVMEGNRIDVPATISRLPEKVPLVQHVMSSIVPPPADLPKVQESLDKLQRSLSRLADMAASIMSPSNNNRDRREERPRASIQSAHSRKAPRPVRPSSKSASKIKL